MPRHQRRPEARSPDDQIPANLQGGNERGHSSAPWEQLPQAQLRRLRSLHGQLMTLELARMGRPPLAGKDRQATIKNLAKRAHAGLMAQMVASKMLLNYLCPGWEAEDLELAQMLAERVPAEFAWADIPVRKVPCH